MQDPYAPVPGNYYAKGFEFEISEPLSVRFSATQNSSSTFLYLAQKNGEQSHLLKQTQSDYGERYEELERHLAPGSYLAEVTTTGREQERSFTASLVELPQTACESFVIIEQSTLLEIGANDECTSAQKPPQSYYDPYASPPYHQDIFYASYNTFTVTETGEYQLTMSNSNIVIDFFLLDGANQFSPLLTSSLGAQSITVMLEPGDYTVETTTEFPNEIGEVTLLVEHINDGGHQCSFRGQNP